jgi:hypothetical protein
MPGGQLTNLLYQSKMLGLSGQWGAVKRSYAAANRILGDIIKVTPSSKVSPRYCLRLSVQGQRGGNACGRMLRRRDMQRCGSGHEAAPFAKAWFRLQLHGTGGASKNPHFQAAAPLLLPNWSLLRPRPCSLLCRLWVTWRSSWWPTACPRTRCGRRPPPSPSRSP